MLSEKDERKKLPVMRRLGSEPKVDTSTVQGVNSVLLSRHGAAKHLRRRRLFTLLKVSLLQTEVLNMLNRSVAFKALL